MVEPLLKTKTIPPRIPERSLYRKRLLNHLGSNINKRLILVCADAGYGKTTLLAQFVQKLDIPFVWYQLDKSDQDFNLFIRYIVEGMRRYVPKFGKRTLGVIDHSKGQKIKLEILVGTFINELLEIPEQRILFLFDDFQEVYRFKKIVTGFEYFLNRIPTNVSITISARSNLPFPLERLQLKNEVLDIDQQDLKFNKSEIKALCKKIAGYSPNPVELKKLETDSEGWITCLQFLIQPPEQRPIFAKTKKSLLNRLYDYFDKEVFSSLDEDIKYLLTATSVLERLSPKVCDFLISRDDSIKTLRRLEKMHLFVSSYDVPQPLYSYHHLFRDFLQKKLKELDLYEQFQDRAGKYFMKERVFSNAIQHYFEAKNFELVGRIIAKIGEDYMTTDKFEFVKYYIENIPEKIINNSSALTRLRGTIYFWDFDLDSAKNRFSRAMQISQRQKNHLEAFKTIFTQLSMKLNLGEHKGIVKQIREVLRSRKLKNRKLKTRFLNNLGIALSFERKSKQAIAAFEKVLKTAKRIDFEDQINIALQNLAIVHAEIGDLDKAQSYLETLVNKLRTNPSLTFIAALYNLGALLKERGALNRAREMTEEALKYAQLFNDRGMVCICYIDLALNKIYAGDLEQAEEILNKAETLALEIGHKYRLSHIWISKAELAMNRGDFFQAKQYSDKALELPIPDMSKAEFMLIKAKVELSLRNLRVAEGVLNQALLNLRESKNLMMRWYIQEARLHLFKNKLKEAKISLNKSITLAENNAYDFILFYELKHCPELLRFIKRTGTRSMYLKHLLLKLPYSEGAKILVEPEITEYDFIVRLFGKAQIFKKKKEIITSLWRTKRFQELFSFFIANHPHTLTRDKIISTFWPDQNHRIAKQLFYNALYSIRKTVGKNIIFFGKGGYILSPKFKYWVDTKEFEKLIKDGDRLAKSDNHSAGLIKYEEAASLYRGGFMDDFYSDWCQQRRQYFEGLFLYLLRQLSNGHYKIGNFDKAMKFCNLVIEKDPYYEDAHSLAMRCYAAVGDLGGLKNCFSNLKKILAKGLKTKPRAETVKLFEALIKQRKA